MSSDSNVRLTATKLIGPDQLVVVILLNNQKHNALTGVTMTIDPPSNLKVNSTTLTKTSTLTSTFTFTGDIDGFACVSVACMTIVRTLHSSNMGLCVYEIKLSESVNPFQMNVNSGAYTGTYC